MNICSHFIIHEFINVISFCKPVNYTASMFIHTPFKIVRDACIQYSIILICHNINVIHFRCVSSMGFYHSACAPFQNDSATRLRYYNSWKLRCYNGDFRIARNARVNRCRIRFVFAVGER